MTCNCQQLSIAPSENHFEKYGRHDGMNTKSGTFLEGDSQIGRVEVASQDQPVGVPVSFGVTK